MKFMLRAWELRSIYHFGPKHQYKELRCHTHFLENCCFIWVQLQLSHNFPPISCWFRKLDQVVESYRQFSILGPNVLNKEIRSHTHFLVKYGFIWIYLQSSHHFTSNKSLPVKIGSGIPELQSIFHFGPKWCK